MVRSARLQLTDSPVINACGIYTDLGGSCLSSTVWAAAAEVNRRFFQLPELLDSSGRQIAEMLGVSAARVTGGASAAISMAVGACMTGGDGRLMEQLPDSSGMRDEVLMQFGHRYKYARCARLAGARILEVGSNVGTTPEELTDALSRRPVVCILHPAHLDGVRGTLPLADILRLAHAAEVPVVVDAAYMSYPTRWITAYRDADVVCLSAKYFWGPNVGGFVYGREELIEAIAGIDFTHFESGNYLIFGRAYKLDRTSVVATTLSLKEWLEMDHEQRWLRYAHQAETIRLAAAGATSAVLGCFTLNEYVVPEPLPENFEPLRSLPPVAALCETQSTVNAAIVDVGSPRRALQITEQLASSDPRILCVSEGSKLVFCTETLLEGDVDVVAEQLRSALR